MTQVTVAVHEQKQRSLSLVVNGANRDAVIDAFWGGLKRPMLGGMLATGNCDIGVRHDGSILIRFEPTDGAKVSDILFEMRVQLMSHARESA